MENQGYFTDKDGKKSMTRLLSFLMFFFFCIMNVVVLTSVLSSPKPLDINTIMFLSGLEFFVLISIFAPKAISKISEMKEIVETFKK